MIASAHCHLVRVVVSMFAFQNCREPSWERVDITAEKPLEAAFVMERTRHGPGVIPSTMHQWRDIRIFGNGLLERGFWHRRRDTDENNEHARFDSVSVYGYSDCGWLIEGKNNSCGLVNNAGSRT